MPDELIGVEAAAERLGLKPAWVRRLCQEGRIPAQKIGKTFVIRAADLEAFAAVPRPKGRRWPKTDSVDG